METLESPAFALAVTISSGLVFLLSLLPLFLSAGLESRLKQHGQLRAARTGEGLTGFDLLLFQFREMGNRGYYLLFCQILFFFFITGIAPYLHRSIATEYAEIASGERSISSLGRFDRIVYEMYGAQQGATAWAVLFVLLFFIGVFTISVTIRRISRGELVE